MAATGNPPGTPGFARGGEAVAFLVWVTFVVVLFLMSWSLDETMFRVVWVRGFFLSAIVLLVYLGNYEWRHEARSRFR